jgi:hypothetical protein
MNLNQQAIASVVRRPTDKMFSIATQYRYCKKEIDIDPVRSTKQLMKQKGERKKFSEPEIT